MDYNNIFFYILIALKQRLFKQSLNVVNRIYDAYILLMIITPLQSLR